MKILSTKKALDFSKALVGNEGFEPPTLPNENIGMLGTT